MPRNFADRLLQAISEKKTPAVVALDPVYEHLPEELREDPAWNDADDAEAALGAILEFCRRVIRVTAPLIPAIKINSAYFERYFGEGVDAYFQVVEEAHAHGLLVIGDVKRGDVGHTAEMYADGHLANVEFIDMEDRAMPDAVTLNGYFGLDGVKPFLEVAASQGKGAFVLVRTSNPSAAAVQDAVLADGRKVHETVAELVAQWAADARLVGESGFSSIGAVTATRNPADAARLRLLMPRSILLVPGYGTQGGTAEDFVPYFTTDGRGAIVAAGRSVIFAFEQAKYAEALGGQWEPCIEQSCHDMIADLARVIPPAR